MYDYNIFQGLLSFKVLFVTIFIASLLWTFGVHFVKLREDRFLSYLGVSSLAVLSSLVYWFIFGGIAYLLRHELGRSGETVLFSILLLLYCGLQIFLNILFGKLVWNTSWRKSFLVWLIPTILFSLGVFVQLIINWV